MDKRTFQQKIEDNRPLMEDARRTYALLIKTAEEKMKAGYSDAIMSIKIYSMKAINKLNQALYTKDEKNREETCKCFGCGQIVPAALVVDGTCIECVNDMFDEWIKTGKVGP